MRPAIRAPVNWAPVRSQPVNLAPRRSASVKSACSIRQSVNTTSSSLLERNEARSIRQPVNVTSRRSSSIRDSPVIRQDESATLVNEESSARRLARSQRSNATSLIRPRRSLTWLRFTLLNVHASISAPAASRPETSSPENASSS